MAGAGGARGAGGAGGAGSSDPAGDAAAVAGGSACPLLWDETAHARYVAAATPLPDVLSALVGAFASLPRVVVVLEHDCPGRGDSWTRVFAWHPSGWRLARSGTSPQSVQLDSAVATASAGAVVNAFRTHPTLAGVVRPLLVRHSEEVCAPVLGPWASSHFYRSAFSALFEAHGRPGRVSSATGRFMRMDPCGAWTLVEDIAALPQPEWDQVRSAAVCADGAAVVASHAAVGCAQRLRVCQPGAADWATVALPPRQNARVVALFATEGGGAVAVCRGAGLLRRRFRVCALDTGSLQWSPRLAGLRLEEEGWARFCAWEGRWLVAVNREGVVRVADLREPRPRWAARAAGRIPPLAAADAAARGVAADASAECAFAADPRAT